MLYFYYGLDTYSIAAAVREFKSRHSLVEELVFEEKERLREVLQSQGLFARNKLVVLRGWVDSVSAGSQPIHGLPEEELINQLTTNSNSILFLETTPPDKRLKFFKRLVKNAEAREFIAPSGAALEKWIKEFAQRGGGKIETAAVKELVGRVGEVGDLWQYAGELEKLLLYDSNVSVSNVRWLVSRNFHDDIFTITNAFAEGRPAEAAAVLERLSAEPVQIVGAFAAQIRSLLLMKSFSGESPAQIAQALNWKEGRVWINQRLAAKFQESRLRGMLRDLLAIDRRIKTTEEPPKLLLQLFVQKVRA